MNIVEIPDAMKAGVNKRSQQLFDEQRESVFCRTDHLFAALMILQWIAGILVAIFISPLSWAGQESQTHVHVWAAVLLGGVIISLPVYFAISYPGRVFTRHTIAIGQMLYSALLIHLTGGRIETHFHIFGSLAFLSFYRDWKVLISASIVTAVDHFMGGVFWPQSVYGVLAASPWRVVEHAFWVVFEDCFLITACRQAVKEMWKLARRQAIVEATTKNVETTVLMRTAELVASEKRMALQFAINSILGGSLDLDEAASKVLQVVGEMTGWQVAIFWKLDRDSQRLYSVDLWYQPGGGFPNFEKISCSSRFQLGESLPGCVWASGKSEWISDVVHAPNFLRAAYALKDGVHGAAAFPVRLQSKVVGVLEFFCKDVRQPDQDLLCVFESIGCQMGQFMEHKWVEDKNRQMATVVECSNDAIIVLDTKGRIQNWNRGAQRIFGYRAAEVSGRSFSILVSGSKTTERDMLLDRVTAGLPVENYECELARKNGTMINVSATWSPVVDQSGELIGASIIARDISERLAAEKRVREFYSTVSHELRTPLTSIRGALGLIESGVLAEAESKELVQVARSSSERLIRLINDILDLRKIEAGKMELDQQSIDVECLVIDTIDAVKGMAEETGMILEHQINVRGPVYADFDRSTQVLTNLLANAIKFSAGGSKIKVLVEPGQGGRVRFSVIDNGPGIPANQLHKLFGKFQQLDSSDTRQHEGTGLGLSICKAIVEEQGGCIGVSSTPGSGSTFWFELPNSLAVGGQVVTAQKSVDMDYSMDDGRCEIYPVRDVGVVSPMRGMLNVEN